MPSEASPLYWEAAAGQSTIVYLCFYCIIYTSCICVARTSHTPFYARAYINSSKTTALVYEYWIRPQLIKLMIVMGLYSLA